MPETAPMTTPAERTRLPHFPALDGIRGPFAIAVLSYHAGMGFPGALTMMTGFFALSGFLITSLLLIEWQQTGRIDLIRFIVNRARRLLPAAMFLLVLIAIFWNLLPLMTVPEAGDFDAHSRLNVDILAATFYVYNWRRAFGPDWEGFSALTQGVVPEASPVSHLWSLSVEEQFYAIFPLCCFVFLVKLKSVRALGFAACLGIVACYTLTPALPSPDSPDALRALDRLYNGTDARLGEVLVGVLLAIAYHTPSGSRFLQESRAVRVAGCLCLVVATYWTFWASIGDWWIYRGGFLILAIVYTTIIAAGIQSQGLVSALFGWPPFQWIGVRSYGLYLYHFPIQRWIDERAVDWGDWTVYSVRMAATFLMAAISYDFLELPIRRRQKPRYPLWWAAAGLASIAALLTAVSMGVWAPE